jgi:hypothetical protein
MANASGKIVKDLIVVHGADRTQCGFQRFVLPTLMHATQLTSNVHIELRRFPVTDVEELKRLVSVVIIRPVDTNWKGFIAYYTQKRQFFGFKVLADFDDPLWSVWPQCRELLDDTARGFDCAVFSTRALKDRFKELYPDVKSIVMPNGVADFMYCGTERDDGEGPRKVPVVLYGGAGGHENDFKGPWGPWLRHKVENGEIDFHCFASPVKPLEHLANMITVHGAVTPPEWGKTLTEIRPDFYIAPVEDNIVNRCKSDLKYKEACELGAVFIGTGDPWSPYRGAPKAQLVENSASEDELEEKFKALCEPGNFAKAIKAQRDVLTEKHLRMTDHVFIGRWLIAYGNCKEA